MVLESANIVKKWFSYNNQLLSLNNIPYNITTSRLALDIPHAVLSFMVNNIIKYKNLNKQFLHFFYIFRIIILHIMKIIMKEKYVK